MSIAARVEELNALLDARRDSTGGWSGGDRHWPGPATVAVLDGSRRLEASRVARLLDEGPRLGIYAVCFAPDETELPVECRHCSCHGRDRHLSASPRSSRSVVDRAIVDLVPTAWACRFAPSPRYGMALLRTGRWTATVGTTAGRARYRTPGGRSPGTVARPRSLDRARIGVSRDRPFDIDLAGDGPHVLVAGTTVRKVGTAAGAGSFIGGRQSTRRDGVRLHRLQGGAFADCARLPHSSAWSQTSTSI